MSLRYTSTQHQAGLKAGITIRQAQQDVAQYLTAKGKEWTSIENHYYLMAHFVEEVGELARSVINIEGRIMEPKRKGFTLRRETKLEAINDAVGDLLYQVFKIAIAYGIDVEKAFEASMKSIRRRYPT